MISIFNPLVSICIPSFNSEKYIEETLTSLFNQTYQHLEIIVVDDGSTDNTIHKLASIKDSRFTFTVQQNKGASAARNKAYSLSTGEYIKFMDADDDLLPNLTTIAHKWMDKHAVSDIILMHYQYRDFITQQLMGESDYVVEEIKSDPIRFTITRKVVNFALIKKASFLSIGGFNTDPSVLYNEDRAFYTRASIAGLSFDYEPELTCINYYYPGSMSANNRALCAKAALNVWNIVKEKTGEKYNKEIAEQLLANATYAATAKDWQTVNGSVEMARSIFPETIPLGSGYFQWLYRVVPKKSFFIREIVIKYFTVKRRKKLPV